MKPNMELHWWQWQLPIWSAYLGNVKDTGQTREAENKLLEVEN